MKRFSKLISVVAGVIILAGVGIYALKDLPQRTPRQDANMQAAIAGVSAENGGVAAPAKAVPAPEDDEIVTIPDDTVITKKYIPPQQGIPAGPGGAAPAGEDEAKAAKELYARAAEFLQIESNEEAVRGIMGRQNAATLDIAYNSAQKELSGLASIFYVSYLGKTADSAVYHESSVSLSSAGGFAHVVSAYDRTGNTAAEYTAATEPGADALVRTEVTEVTVFEADKSTAVTTTVVTAQKADGTSEAHTDVSTKTIP